MNKIWHNPTETPINDSIVIVDFRNNLYIGKVYIYPDGNYCISEMNINGGDNYWKSEINRWCYSNDIKNLK